MKYRTYTIGDKTYSDEEFQLILAVKDSINKLQEVQDKLYKDLEMNLCIKGRQDYLFDFVYNDCGDSLPHPVKINLVDE